MIVEQVVDKNRIIAGEEAAAMGDIGPYELAEGRIVPMGPTVSEHGSYESNFHYVLRSFVQSRKLGKVQVGEVGIYTRRDPDTVRGADVLFISNERYAQQKSPGFLKVAPDLVVEILSPHDRWSEVMEKLREYFAIGVRLVWVADPQSRSVYAYRTLTEVREFSENDDLPGDDVLPGFSVKVVELFED
jgi:Uma2 family endonuclease